MTPVPAATPTPVPTPTPTPTPTPVPTPIPTPTPTPTPVATPSTTSAEYKRNPGLDIMHVNSAWAAGATGQGQKIAVIDSSVDGTSFDLTGKVSSDSTDLIAGRPSTDAVDRHGTQIGGVIAANFNSVGTVGAAFNAQILSIRADTAGTCASECSFNTNTLARGITYAVAHGAKIINLSLGDSAASGTTFENALKAAVDAGVVIVAAAGNDAAAESIYPARYAVDSRYSGALIAAGALNTAGTDIATFSNRAGLAATGYLLAPGQGVRTDCDSAGTCSIVAGTSFAAPAIAADLALLLEAFPSLTGRQAVDILLRTATDMGATGTDAIYGRGQVNMTKAFAPVGSLSVQSPSGATYEAANDSTTTTATMSSAFGQSLKPQSALNLKTVAFDNYHRMYKVDLADAYTTVGRRSPLAPVQGPANQSSVNADLPSGAQLSLSAQKSIAPLYQQGGIAALTEASRNDAVSMSYRSAGLSFDLWSGRSGLAPTFSDAPSDAYSGLALARQTARAGYSLGRWTLSAEQGFGGHRDDPTFDYARNFNAQTNQSSSYSRATAAVAGRAWTAAFSAGLLNEQGGPLGSSLPTGSAYALPSATRYLQGQVMVRPLSGLALTATAATGDTSAHGGAFALAARSTSWTLQADATCGVIKLCSGAYVSLAQPVRVERGTLSAYLAEQPLIYTDPLTYSLRSITAAPDGRELDMSMGLWRDMGQAGTLRLQATAFTQESNRRDAPLNLGVMASWGRRF